MFRNKVYALRAWQCASLLLLDLFLQEIMMAWECMTYVATILLQIFIKENLDETLSRLWGKIDSQEKYQDKRCISEKIKQNTNDATFPNPKLVLSRLNFFSWTLGWGKVQGYGWINDTYWRYMLFHWYQKWRSFMFKKRLSTRETIPLHFLDPLL